MKIKAKYNNYSSTGFSFIKIGINNNDIVKIVKMVKLDTSGYSKLNILPIGLVTQIRRNIWNTIKGLDGEWYTIFGQVLGKVEDRQMRFLYYMNGPYIDED